MVVAQSAPAAGSRGAERGRSSCRCVALFCCTLPCARAPPLPFLRPPLTPGSMEVMEGPLNLAHQQSRQADRLLAAGKYEEAISCHKKAAAYLSEAMKLTQSEQAHLSLELQRESHMKQLLLIQERWKRAKREERLKAQQSSDKDAAAQLQASHKPSAEDADGQSPLLSQRRVSQRSCALEAKPPKMIKQL